MAWSGILSLHKLAGIAVPFSLMHGQKGYYVKRT